MSFKYVACVIAVMFVVVTSAVDVNNNNNVEYNTMIRKLQEDVSATANSKLQTQIFVWMPIILIVVLYFTVMSMANMSIQKSSILYAKYGTNRSQQELH